jgi:predicted metal-dependent hydrolase
MNETKALERVTEVEVSHTAKKQIEQYEPETASTTIRAEVGADDDPEELADTLSQFVQRQVKEDITRRLEEHLRKEMSDD